jgi:hypothetical protein
VVGRSENGSRRNFSIDGKDMFIAFRVASQEQIAGAADTVRLKRVDEGWEAQMNGRTFVMQSTAACSGSPPPPDAALFPARIAEAASPTPPHVDSAPRASVATSKPSADEVLMFPLRVPVADGKGGLFDRASVRRSEKQLSSNGGGSPLCSTVTSVIKADMQLLGWRLQAFRNPKAPRW